MSPQKPKPNLGGVAAVADLLNRMDSSDRERLITELAKRDGDLTAKIQEQMFTFANLAGFEDREMQTLLRQVPKDLLAIALRSAPPEVSAAIFRNLSARAAEALREDLAASAPRKVSEVEAAQAAILKIAKTLIAEGKLVR